jgi:uncharacterized protein YbgA (DUF1722 family)
MQSSAPHRQNTTKVSKNHQKFFAERFDLVMLCAKNRWASDTCAKNVRSHVSGYFKRQRDGEAKLVGSKLIGWQQISRYCVQCKIVGEFNLHVQIPSRGGLEGSL